MLAGGLALFFSATAGAQTTTSTSSTSSSTTTSSTTTTTTLVNPCAGQPCTPQPPTAFLSGSGGEVPLQPDSYCWRQVDGLLTNCLTPSAAPGGGGDPSQTLVVQAGETLSLRFAIGMAPTSVSLTRTGEQPRALAPTNPTVLPVDLAPGGVTAGVVTKWRQGDVTNSLRHDVPVPPPTATPRC